MSRSKISKILLLTSFPLLIFSVKLWAWPLESDWIPVYYNTGYLSDEIKSGSTDIVGDTTTYPAASLYTDDAYFYYRLRLNDDPRKGGSGYDEFGWGVLIDTDLNGDDFEWLIMVDGRLDEVRLEQNIFQDNIGDPSDHPEITVWSEPLSTGYLRTTVADSTYSGDADYFLDFRVPCDVLLTATGLTDSSLIRYFYGTSSSGQTLSTDLAGGEISTLSEGLSEPIIPSGTLPTTGSVRFVTDLDGTGDMTSFYAGETLHIRVDDDDQNGSASGFDTVEVTLTAPSGDTVTVTLTETGADTGTFTGSVSTAQGSPTVDGVLQVRAIETIRATYIDGADADLNQDEPRTDQAVAMPVADLSISKSVTPTTPDIGETITYTLTLTNTGPSSASGIQVTDTLPAAAIENISASGPGTFNTSTGVWSAPDLAAGESAELSITATVKTGTSLQTYVNTAEITASAQPDPTPANNTASVSFTVKGADPSITKVASNITPRQSDSITYTITITNNGAYDATGVAVTDDTLTAASTDFSGITWQTFDEFGNPKGAYNSTTGIWNVGDLANGESARVEITATVDAAAGDITNTATVTADQGDPVSSNNTATETISVGGADISLSKSVSENNPNEGDTITYTLTVSNTNAVNDANSVTLTDTLPSGLTFVSASGGGVYDSATRSCTWNLGAIAASSFTEVTLQASINSGTGGGSPLVNSATATMTPPQTDPDTSNNNATSVVTVQYADLSLTKTVDNATPNKREYITFTVGVTNNGAFDATGVEISDILPDWLTVNLADSANAAWSYDSATKTYRWAVGTVSNGATVTTTLKVYVDLANNDDPAGAFNTVRITNTDQADPVPGNNVASVMVKVEGVDVAISKAVDNPSPGIGETVIFAITVKNLSPTRDATGLQVTDVMPAELTSPVIWSGDFNGDTNLCSQSGGYSYATTSGIWSAIPTLYKTTDTTAGHYNSATLCLRATVGGTAGTVVVNQATITAVDQIDSDPTNDQAEVSVNIGGTDLSLSKTASDHSPEIGDTVTYNIVVTNTGLYDVVSLDVTDILPEGLTFASYSTSPAGSLYNSATGLWNVGALAASASATLTLNATVDNGTAGFTLTNEAEITAINGGAPSNIDPNAANNTASDSVTVQMADLRIVKTVDNPTPDEGANVVYTLTATNLGPHTSTGVTVTDLLPPEVIYLSDDSGGLYNSATGLWNVGDLAKTESAVLNITARTGSMTGGMTITNEASVPAGAGDPNSANNTAFIDITPLHVVRPNITLVKTVSVISDPVNGTTRPKAIPGAVMLYTVTATNFGDGATDAGTVLIEDPIPSNTAYVPGSLTLTNNTGDPQNAPPLAPPEGVSYDDAFGAPCPACPTDDGTGVDPNVGGIKITLPGTLPASNGVTNPSFTIQFKVRIE